MGNTERGKRAEYIVSLAMHCVDGVSEGWADIENLLYLKYGQGDTLTVMSFLYPWADLHNLFHVDHIFPKAEFTERKLRKMGISSDRITDFLENFNYIGNLQLLEGLDNTSKINKDFKKWFEDNLPTEEAKTAYRQKH